ncbi:MAG: exodeoxyribonuclease VII large subunit [Flavobacteriales bacterium]|nr:exodeoxyribonuclease VII large subunit [Flavobacteriales bacterium]
MTQVGRNVLKKAHSLLDLTENIKQQIEKTYKSSYWVKAEINRLNYYPQSGHCYPELVEKNNGKIVAEIRGFLFRNLYEEIDQNFVEQTGKRLGDGMEVLLLCRVSFDPKYGLSLYISDIDASFTLGEMARLREEAIKRLKAESLLEKNKTTTLPYPVKRLAVVSVETSKGWRDFIQTLDSNHYGHLISHELFPAKLQGDMAVASIRAALSKIEKRNAEFEAVAIIRGGGGETGMDCYDQYELAKAIAIFPIPVLTGIGHSTNLTISEICSYQNLITPTALAQFLVDKFAEFEYRLEKASDVLSKLLSQTLPLESSQIQQIGVKLKLSTDQRIKDANKHLQRSGTSLKENCEQQIDRENRKMDLRVLLKLGQASQARLSHDSNRVDSISRVLEGSSKERLSSNLSRINFLEAKTRLLDPANVLKRGYSITQVGGKSISSAAEIKEGDEVRTVLAKGEFTSTVKKKKNG